MNLTNCDLSYSHGWNLPFTPYASSVPVTFPEPIPFTVDAIVTYYTTIWNRTEQALIRCVGELKGYDNTGTNRPHIELAVGETSSFFGMIFESGCGVIDVSYFRVAVLYNGTLDHTDTYTTFDQNFAINAGVLTDMSIQIIECNLPIIFWEDVIPTEEDPEVNYYTRTEWLPITTATVPTFERVLNWEESIPAGKEFLFKCMWTIGTWDDQYPPTITSVNYQGYRGIIEYGSVKLISVPGIYQTPTGKALVYKVDSDAVFYNLEKTTDGVNWETASELPEFFYREHINELGTFAYAISSEYNNPDDLPDNPDPNPTGDPDDGDDWGDVYSRSFFTQQYLLTENAVQEISNGLYDITPGGIWEDIKKGVEMFGDNPMNSVVNLSYYPLDLSTVFTNTSSGPDVWFGGYDFVLQNNTALKLVYPDGHFKAGGVRIRPTFKTRDWRLAWLDIYNVRLFIDLPYVGRYELDPSRYYNKFIKVIYYIDTRTGSCVACLVEGGTSGDKNGVCLDSFNGQIGTQIPITLTDFSAYANNQINTLLGNGGQALSAAGGQITQASQAVGLGSAAGVAGAGVGMALIGGIQGAKTVYGLEMNNINRFNQTRGGSTSMLNQYLNQLPKFIFQYYEPDIPSNYYEMKGGPSNYSGTVGGFTGYLECDQCKLNMPGATEAEKEKARSLLMNGVYI